MACTVRRPAAPRAAAIQRCVAAGVVAAWAVFGGAADPGEPSHWKLAPRPPLGWNSWDIFGTTVTEEQVRAQAAAMAEHLLPAGAHVSCHANLWRITDDFWDRWPLLYAMFERLAAWTPFRRPGAWPDADMLPLGVIDFGRPTGLTADEQQTLMTLWSIGRSPLIFGGDMTRLDAATKALLTNPAVLAVNQESDRNRELSRDDDLIVWVAEVPGAADRFVALFNARSDAPRDRGGEPATAEVGLDLEALGIAGAARVRDLWSGEDLGEVAGRFARRLRCHASGLYRLSPVE